MYDSLKDRENIKLTMHGYYLSFWNDTDIVWQKNITMFKYQSFVTRILQVFNYVNNLSNCKICPQETQIFFGGIYLYKSPYKLLCNTCICNMSHNFIFSSIYQKESQKYHTNKTTQKKKYLILCLLTNVKLLIK